MERMLVVVFNNEDKAYEGSRALKHLDEIGEISLYASEVLIKDFNGATTVDRTRRPMPEGTMGATAVGSLIGLLGGPVGLAVGAGAGVLVGVMTDLTWDRVGKDFVEDVKKVLIPGKAAVVAEIEEGDTDPVDDRM